MSECAPVKKLALLSVSIPLSLALVAGSLGACSITTRAQFDDAGTEVDPNNPANGDSGSLFGDASLDDSGNPNGPCAPSANNAEIAGNNCDDDGDGKVDNAPTCDTGLDIAGDATSFAKAMGICDAASAKGHGLVSATYTRGFNRTDAPQAGQHGILAKFGNMLRPREGNTFAAISTGWAREFNASSGTKSFAESQDWYNFGVYAAGKAGNGAAPPGFPKPASGCPTAKQANDVIDVKLVLKVPPNAKGIAFDFNFHSSEWPAYLCSEFNDAFIAYLSSKANTGGAPDNIAFDSQKNPVSVNNGFFDRCTPNAETGCEGTRSGTSTCPGGPGELGGTGFGQEEFVCSLDKKSTLGGATGWLTSTAPVQPGEEITLEFIIWDTGDGQLDSLTLLDNFRWVAGETKTETARPR